MNQSAQKASDARPRSLDRGTSVGAMDSPVISRRDQVTAEAYRKVRRLPTGKAGTMERGSNAAGEAFSADWNGDFFGG